ncbi:hypothetical protein JCGZ_11833 [Jatropha curcas]|uniref:RING-type E3 ubiquitin transferase n=1 Tax=Jatropha curcas TaxID=180498 RepID=A0A067LMA4_JATCU|nr:hypothetical protein JCGZ_11833 [Jatropha curcas]
MSVKSSKGKRFGWGNAYPISMDDKIAERNVFYRSGLQLENSKKETKLKAMNISYQISLTSYNASSMEYKNEQISAEGTYDGETGVICMVGCKYQTSANESMDCEILVHVEFSATNSKDYIEGRIQSTREKSSPLYFESLSFSAVPYYSQKESIWRMDMEIIMALISNTLVCIFVGYQILHMKKNPSVFPYISLVMLAVLTLGRTIPLMLNFEVLFLSKQNTQRLLLGGWLEMHEVIVRGVTMVAFLLQFRLLQLVWSARLADKNQKASWIAEKKALYVSLPLYIAGGLIALFLNWKINNKFNDGMGSTSFYGHQHSVLVDLRSYAGLVLDCFLFPQIIFNIFLNSREKALSSFFYMGTTLVRLIPHAYDLYREHYYFDDLDWSYMYAEKAADFFSTAWDVIIPLGGLFLAATIYLQQRNGGRCFLPKKFKEPEVYEKLSMADNA